VTKEELLEFEGLVIEILPDAGSQHAHQMICVLAQQGSAIT